MSTSYGSLQISYCEGSRLADCGHTTAVTICSDHAKTSGVPEFLKKYISMTPDERKAVMTFVRMTPEERAKIVGLNAELKRARDTIAKFIAVRGLMKKDLKREAGPDAPESRKVAKKTRSKDKEKSSEDDKPRKKSNHPGVTDDRRASKRYSAVFGKCSCGGDEFMVDSTDTRTLDDILDALIAIEQFTEMKGKCTKCGAKAVGKLFRENGVDISAEDRDISKPSEYGKEHSDALVPSERDAPDVVAEQDPVPDAPPSDADSKRDAPDVVAEQDPVHPALFDLDADYSAKLGMIPDQDPVLHTPDKSRQYGDVNQSMTAEQDPVPDAPPSDADSKQDTPKGKTWVKTESGRQVLLTAKAAAKHPGPVPDSVVRKGSIVKASDTKGKTEIKIPKKGRLNFGVLELIAVLWGHRVTLEGASEIIDWLCRLGYSRTTIMNALSMMSAGLKPFTDDVLAQLLNAPTVYIDETTFRVGKKLRYVWVITDGRLVYYFAHTRAVTKLIELFDGYAGVVVCDGYHTKNLFSKVQRCWAHILRTTKWHAEFEKKYSDSTMAQDFHNAVRDLFHKAVDEKLNGRGTESYDMILSELWDIIKHYEQFTEINDSVGHVRNAADKAFTFMKHEYTPPTNNIAEQAMREIVKHRVMRVLFRTWDGLETFVIILSVIETCKKRKIDIGKILRKYL